MSELGGLRAGERLGSAQRAASGRDQKKKRWKNIYLNSEAGDDGPPKQRPMPPRKKKQTKMRCSKKL